MRDDLLKIISSAKEVSNAIVLTHNIDFVFVQTVALAAFRRSGHPTLTIFADAACAAESFAHQRPLLDGLGVRYRVVPVSMSPGFRFHPKAVLLSSEEAATLLVGSGNLTFGGWRENAEVWLRFDSDQDGVAPFHAFKGYLTEVMARIPLPDAVKAEVEEAFDPKSKTWVSMEATNDAMLVGRVGAGNSLLDQMLDMVGSEPVDELLVCSPYFDDHGVGLREIVARANAHRTTVLCQPERSTLTQRSWEPSSGQAVLQKADFTRTDASGEERTTFMHAKFYAFVRDHQVTVLAGSANCSQAALTISGSAGNAELQAAKTVTRSEFEEEFLGELKVASEHVTLRDGPALDPIDRGLAGPSLRILAARFEAQSLHVAYTPVDASVVGCLIDEAPARFINVKKGIVHATSSMEPKVVAIQARIGNELVESAHAWIDLEQRLRATARGRSLADSIRARIQPGEWNASGWIEVLDVFCKNLSYMPAHRTGMAVSRSKSEQKTDGELEFTADDVFSPSYSPPSLGSIRIPDALGRNEHLQSLQQLLLRWFGIAIEEPEGKDETSDGSEEEGEDNVDRPETLHVAPPSKPSPASKVTERDKRRIEALLSQIEESMTSKEFLADRGPDYLAADIKVASVILRLGLREGWVEHKRFFDLTHKIWSSLFFSSEQRKDVGWLEYRFSTAEDRVAFINAMRSAELSAALIGWKLGAPSNAATPEASRFAFAAVLAVARLPWLWYGGESEKIAEELAVLLSHTTDPGVRQEDFVCEAEAEWALLLRRGQAFRLLEAAVRRMTPAEICDRILIDELHPGDLLWQGTAGFCVVRQQASRVAGRKVKVLKLQGVESESKFIASSTVPMRALLSEDVVPCYNGFGDEQREVLRIFLDDLSKAFVG